MKLALLDFGRPRKDHREEAVSAVWEYLGCLRRNGQVVDSFFDDEATQLLVSAFLPAASALAPRFHSRWARDALTQVKKACGRAPRRTIVGPAGSPRPPSWRAARFLYLFTTFLERGSPVRAAGEDAPIPLYLLPASPDLRQGIDYWAAGCRLLDELWIRSGALEIPAYRQGADPRSELAEEGREICAGIEKATRKPTYYYLDRYYGRRRGEESRPCPLCGKPWRREAGKDGGRRRFGDFAFRCDPCRLVSHLADETASPRLARIGEFRPARGRDGTAARGRQGRR